MFKIIVKLLPLFEAVVKLGADNLHVDETFHFPLQYCKGMQLYLLRTHLAYVQVS